MNELECDYEAIYLSRWKHSWAICRSKKTRIQSIQRHASSASIRRHGEYLHVVLSFGDTYSHRIHLSFQSEFQFLVDGIMLCLFTALTVLWFFQHGLLWTVMADIRECVVILRRMRQVLEHAADERVELEVPSVVPSQSDSSHREEEEERDILESVNRILVECSRLQNMK